jgi:hypothetical protein
MAHRQLNCAGILKQNGLNNMAQIVEIVGVGPVEFPDGMSKEDMAAALQTLPQAQPAPKPVGAYDRFLESLRNPQTGGKSGVVGPALVGGAGELIRGAGALTQLAFPNAGSRMVEVGEAMTQGAKSVAPVSATAGQIGSYLVPFGAAQKATSAVAQVPQVAKAVGMLPSYARAMGQQSIIGGATGYALTPDQQGREESAAFGAIAGPAGELIAPVARTTGKAMAEALGLSTGVGGEPIRQAFRAGQTGNQQFVQNMRGQVPVAELLEQAQGAMQTLKQNRRTAYEQGFQTTKQNQTFLDFKPIEQKFDGAIKNLTITGVGGVSASKVGQKTLDDVAEIKAVIDEWKAKPELHTAEGLDALKRRVDDVYRNDMTNTAKGILTQTRGAIKNTIVKQDPNYAKTMRDYESALGLERELEKALSLGDNASIDTALRKLQSLGRDNVNTSYAYRKDLADTLRRETGVDLMPAVAGQSMSSITPRGIQRVLPSITATGGITGAALAGPAAAIPLLTLPLQSPRLVGEAVYGAGKASRPVLDLANSGTPEQRQLAKLLIMKAAEQGARNE